MPYKYIWLFISWKKICCQYTSMKTIEIGDAGNPFTDRLITANAKTFCIICLIFPSWCSNLTTVNIAADLSPYLIIELPHYHTQLGTAAPTSSLFQQKERSF